jgi:SanA protein
MLLKLLFILGLITIILFILPRIITSIYSKGKIFTPFTSPAQKIAIVFGAGLKRDGSPTAILQDRVAAAADLYFKGKIEKILMSGDNRFLDYNEPGAMYNYAIALGVPAEDIVMDFAGRRTYDTCYRARNVFLVNEAILVTQRFHLPRALYLCNMLKIKSIGVESDRRSYRTESQIIWGIRETFATITALADLWITHPTPILGDPEPIFSDN